jgi:hypothetical protein
VWAGGGGVASCEGDGGGFSVPSGFPLLLLLRLRLRHRLLHPLRLPPRIIQRTTRRIRRHALRTRTPRTTRTTPLPPMSRMTMSPPPRAPTMRSQPLLLRDIRRVFRGPTARGGGDVAVVVFWHATAATARVFVFEGGSGRAAGGRGGVTRFSGGVGAAAGGLWAARVGVGFGVGVICSPRAIARSRSSGVRMRRLHIRRLMSRLRIMILLTPRPLIRRGIPPQPLRALIMPFLDRGVWFLGQA